MQEEIQQEYSPWLLRGRSWWLLEETSPCLGRAAGQQSPSPGMEGVLGHSQALQHMDIGKHGKYGLCGYHAFLRSCVVFVGEDELVAVGTNGLDYSQDGGENWQNVKNVGGNKKLGWNTVAHDPMTGIFWIVGSGGKVVTMVLEN